jgi:hypothetical protein
MTKNPASDAGWLTFDVHGRVRMGVACTAPTGVIPLQDIFADMAAILGKALQRVPTFLLQVPVAYDADRASDMIVNRLAAVTSALGAPLRAGHECR